MPKPPPNSLLTPEWKHDPTLSQHRLSASKYLEFLFLRKHDIPMNRRIQIHWKTVHYLPSPLSKPADSIHATKSQSLSVFDIMTSRIPWQRLYSHPWQSIKQHDPVTSLAKLTQKKKKEKTKRKNIEFIIPWQQDILANWTLKYLVSKTTCFLYRHNF